jgi:8-oxo-dGTP diphosphatase
MTVKSRDEVSAGGLVVRRSERGVEVLICKDSFYHRWSLPKGIVDRGETYEQAAVREVREEGGVHARIVAPLGEPEKYVFTQRGVRIFKTVHYFLLEYESGSTEDHDTEVEEAAWMSLDEAIQRVAYSSIKNLLERHRAMIESVGQG